MLTFHISLGLLLCSILYHEIQAMPASPSYYLPSNSQSISFLTLPLSLRCPLHHSLLLQGTHPHDHYASAKKKDFRTWNKWEGEVPHLYIILRWSSIWRWSYQNLEPATIPHDLGVLNSHIVFAFESIMSSEFSQQRNTKLSGSAKLSGVTFKMLSGDSHSKASRFPIHWPLLPSSLCSPPTSEHL